MKIYKRKGTALLYQGRKSLGRDEAWKLVERALGIKRARWFFHRLEEQGETSERRQVLPHRKSDETNWVQLHGRASEGNYRFFCIGPQVVELMRKINKLAETRASQVESNARRAVRRRQKLNTRIPTPPLLKKSRVKEVREARGQVVYQMPCRKAPDRQFHKTSFAWDSCVDMATAVFQVPRDGKNTARQIVARRLYRSLEKSGWRYAQYKQSGFTLHFAAQGPWLVDMSTATVKTRMVVSCIKDNRNPIYRRLRKQLRKERRLGLCTPLRLIA